MELKKPATFATGSVTKTGKVHCHRWSLDQETHANEITTLNIRILDKNQIQSGLQAGLFIQKNSLDPDQ